MTTTPERGAADPAADQRAAEPSLGEPSLGLPSPGEPSLGEPSSGEPRAVGPSLAEPQAAADQRTAAPQRVSEQRPAPAGHPGAPAGLPGAPAVHPGAHDIAAEGGPDGDGAPAPAAEGPGGGDPGDRGRGRGRGGGLPGLPPARDLPRWVRWTVIPLLVLVPLGYVIISAEQSRDSGQGKQKEAAARHLTWEVPSELQRRIYQVPIPDATVGDGYLETNSWDTSEFYCQFTTSAGGLDTFLAQLGTSRAALRDGKVSISRTQAAQVGWNFDVPHHWAGMSTHQVGDKPDHDITVDLTHADTPVVYVVSTVNFQHGFGGG